MVLWFSKHMGDEAADRRLADLSFGAHYGPTWDIALVSRKADNSTRRHLVPAQERQLFSRLWVSLRVHAFDLGRGVAWVSPAAPGNR
jgi:hypothetical protein